MLNANPMLSFKGQAAEAIEQYTTWFKHDFKVLSIAYTASTDLIAMAELKICDHHFFVNDSFIDNEITFSPAFSFLIDCDSSEEIEYFATELAIDGTVMMPLDSYGFSEKFIWLQDRFGVSWQFTLNSFPI